MIYHSSFQKVMEEQIFVRGFDNRSIIYTIKPSTFVSDLKEEIQENQHVPKEKQRLVFEGKQLLRFPYEVRHYHCTVSRHEYSTKYL